MLELLGNVGNGNFVCFSFNVHYLPEAMHSSAQLMRRLQRFLQVDGDRQSCRLVCKEGVWRGPFCGPQLENRKVTEYLYEPLVSISPQ